MRSERYAVRSLLSDTRERHCHCRRSVCAGCEGLLAADPAEYGGRRVVFLAGTMTSRQTPLLLGSSSA